ncbi:MAG: flagellin [Beijerinckiaceae bacterium]
MSDIVLSSGIRSNLLSLQNSSNLLDRTQNRIATGRKVNTALDDPLNYFTSSSLSAQSKDLNRLLDGINLGMKTLEAADNGIRSIQRLVESALGNSRAALSSASTTAKVGSGMHPVTRQAIDYTQNPNLLLSGTPQGPFDGGEILTFSYSVPPSAVMVPINVTLGGAVATAQDVANAINTAPGNLDTATQQPYLKATIDVAGRLIIDNTANGALRIQMTDAGATTNTLANLFGTYEPPLPTSTGTDTGVITYKQNITRNAAAQQYNDLLTQITNIAKDSGYNGVNLLYGQSLDMVFNADATTRMIVRGVVFDAAGIGLATTDSKYSFQSDVEINAAIAKLNNAVKYLQSQATTFGSNMTVAQTRRDFTNEATKTLKAGSDGLVTADMNEEGANLLALQTRQQMSTQALSLAAQSDQAVLRLFS